MGDEIVIVPSVNQVMDLTVTIVGEIEQTAYAVRFLAKIVTGSKLAKQLDHNVFDQTSPFEAWRIA